MTPPSTYPPSTTSVDRRQGPPAAPDIAEAPDKFAQLLSAGAASGPAPRARCFNEDGMLGHAIDLPVEGVPATRFEDTAMAAVPALPADEAAVAELSSVLPRIAAPADAAFPSVPLVPQGPRTQPVPQHAPELHASFPQEITIDAPAQPEDQAVIAAPSRRTQRFVPAAQTSLLVALHALDRGLQVTAQVEALDDAERLELHDEIAALLARHGLAADHIHIRASAPGRTRR